MLTPNSSEVMSPPQIPATSVIEKSPWYVYRQVSLSKPPGATWENFLAASGPKFVHLCVPAAMELAGRTRPGDVRALVEMMGCMPSVAGTLTVILKPSPSWESSAVKRSLAMELYVWVL